MRYVGGLFFCGLVICATSAAFGASLIQPAQFPNTFADLPFTERVEILRAGYEPWESEYDTNGHCIRGCPYPGITIEKDLDMMQRQTNAAVAQLQTAGLLNQNGTLAMPGPTGTATTQTQPAAPSQTTATASAQNSQQSAVPPSNINSTMPTCNPCQPEINAANTVPLGEPLVGRPHISSPFGDRIHPITGIRTPHKGVDFAVPTGTDVFSPAQGTVTSVWTNDTCGRGLKITHSNGYETVYCHLSEHLVKNGDVVNAGCRIAKSGNTGRSTGPHLHYGVKFNGGYINPAKLMGRN